MANEEEAKKAPEAAAAGAAEGAAAAGAKPKSGILPIIIIGGALIVVIPIVTIVGVKMFMPSPSLVVKEKAETAEAGEPATYSLKEIYVNIAETKGTRILKIVPFLVLSEQKLATEIAKYDALLRDRVSMAASSMTIDELEGPNGRETLKKEIAIQINTALKDRMAGAVVDVYFSEFLIQ